MNLNPTQILTILSALLIGFLSYSQDNGSNATEATEAKKHSVKDYPDGFYYTIDDFVNKTPKPYPKIEKRRFYRDQLLPEDSDENQIFFFTVGDATKVKNVFAVSFHGNVYIQQRYLMKYAKKGNRNEGGDNPNMYHRILNEGRFFYLEGEFSNGLAKGVAYGTGGAVGGVIGSSLNHLKGVVFDVEKKEFDFIKNCDDFNLFLTEYKSEEKVDCKQYSTSKVREIIEKIITDFKY